MFINMINVKWLLLHTNFLHFCYILVHNFMDYILNLWRKKPGNRNYVCMVTCCQWSQLSSLLQDNITKDNKQLPAADGGVVVDIGGLFANSFLSKFSMLSMLYWESGSDDHISVCNYSWFMIPVLAPCPHQLQTHTVQFCFYPFPAGGGWLLCDFGSQCLALLQATTEGSITWNHEQLWWSQASEPCHHVAVMLAAVQIRKAVCLQCGHGGCCSAAGDNGKRQWSAY